MVQGSRVALVVGVAGTRPWLSAAAMAKKEKDEDNGKDTMARVKEAGYKWSKDLISYNSTVGQNWNPDQCFQSWTQNRRHRPCPSASCKRSGHRPQKRGRHSCA